MTKEEKAAKKAQYWLLYQQKILAARGPIAPLKPKKKPEKKMWKRQRGPARVSFGNRHLISTSPPILNTHRQRNLTQKYRQQLLGPIIESIDFKAFLKFLMMLILFKINNDQMIYNLDNSASSLLSKT